MLGAENTVVITSDPPMPEVPRKASPKSHAYNKKCQDYRIFWQVGPFNFSMECNQPTKRGHLYCEKHQQEVKGIDTRIAELEARILYCAKHSGKDVK